MTHEQLAAMEWALEVLGCIYSPVNERDIEEVGTRMATLRTIIEQAKRQQTLAAPVPDVSLIDEGKTAAPVQEGRDWSLLEATQESLREHMAEIGRLKAIIDAAGQQEPVAWAVHYKGPIPLFTKTKSEAEAWGGNKIVPLYTTPPAVPVQEPVACQHKRYSVDVHEQTGTCYDCGAEGRMRFVVGDATSPTAPVQEK